MELDSSKARLAYALKQHHTATQKLILARRDYDEERQRLMRGTFFTHPITRTLEHLAYGNLGESEQARERLFLLIFDEQYPGLRRQLQTLEDDVANTALELRLAWLEYESCLYEVRVREVGVLELARWSGQ